MVASLAIGYALGRCERARKSDAQSQGVSSEYFVGLNYLLNEQTDEAIESFIRALKVNSEAVETFMVLGRLFRRRGELDRAIQIHQDLLARPSLSRERVLDVQLELARDYKKAGVFDRAETLLRDIVRQYWPGRRASIQTLLSIYEREKEWDKAVQLVSSLKGAQASSLESQHSHYLCQLAEKALRQSDLLSARKFLRLATKVYDQNVRVSLLKGQVELEIGNPRAAIRALERIIEQDRAFIPESVSLLENGYSRLRSQRGLSAYLGRCLREAPSAAVIMAYARSIIREQGEAEAERFVAEQIGRCPSLKGLNILIDLHLQTVDGHARHNLVILRELTGRLESSKSLYRCHQCGFDGRELHWQCPSCHQWATVRPIVGLEGI